MDDGLILTIRVSSEDAEHVIDAVNETLNTLASEGVLNDDKDDAWAWTGRENSDG